ncbi:MAG: hypothetical protein IKR69_01695 [Bacteroidales bacterium]|nr:hypothetical protein [Bacteroidales bacterium]
MCKKKRKDKDAYKWKFASVGGSVRVKISSGEDIRNLGKLDRKLWTVLSCPVTGLEFDEKTLGLIDSNGDGKIRVDEVIATAGWLTSVISDPELLLKGDSTIPFSAFNTENEAGAKLLASAKQILRNLGLEKEEISIEDTADNTRIFADTKFNGDGIITEASSDDPDLKALIAKIAACIGSATDRSGAPGVTAENIEAFYSALADYAAWQDVAEADKKNVYPYGDSTEAALGAVEALKDKIADFFVRCKIIRFNEDASAAVDVSIDKIGAISGGNLALQGEELASYPLGRPNKEALLSYDSINPAWQGAFQALRALVLDVDFPKAESLGEEDWNAVLSKFAAYTAWKAAKKGSEVESLGLEDIKAILKADRKAALLELVAKDKELEEEALSIESVDKLLRLYRDFYRFLNNYVVLSDFYDKEHKAIFQAGRLYIDQRSTDLCVRVQDMGRQADVASLSGMYILYCTCTSKVKNATMQIAAVLTNGDVDDLRVGRNAIFYDRDGVDWDATVTKIVDNPISVRQAFWAPYKKVARWISEKIDKSAAEKDSKSMEGLTKAADGATTMGPDGKPAPEKPSTFDIAKFAGIFAAIGMAVAYLSQALVALFKGASGMPSWKLLVIILVIMLVISGPSMFIAWRKLRKRDLGPLLNANGWAVNAAAYVRIKFGATLTKLAKYPKLKFVDKEARRKARWRTAIWCTLLALLIAFAALFFTDNLKCIGLPFHKEAPVEEVAESEAPASEDAAPASEAIPEIESAEQ